MSTSNDNTPAPLPSWYAEVFGEPKQSSADADVIRPVADEPQEPAQPQLWLKGGAL